MIGSLGLPELLIVLVIIVVLFGVGRISKISGELGKSIRSFKDGLQGDEKNDQQQSPSDQETPKQS